MNRRTVLAGAGVAIAGLAGCAGEPGRDTDDSTLTDRTDGTTRPTPTRTAKQGAVTDRPPESASTALETQRRPVGTTATLADGTSLTVANPTVQRSIVAYHSQFLSVERADGRQFVVVSVAGDTDVDPSSFVLARDGTTQSPPQTQQYVRSVTRECDGTCIGVPVETEGAASAAVAYRPGDDVRAAWALDDTTVAAFPNVPALRVRDAAVTDEDGDVGIELSVDNVGDREGVFLALVAPAWVADVEEPFGFPVPQDEVVTTTFVPNELEPLGPDEATFSRTPTADTRRFEVGPES
jgi:hypothetical protein